MTLIFYTLCLLNVILFAVMANRTRLRKQAQLKAIALLSFITAVLLAVWR